MNSLCDFAVVLSRVVWERSSVEDCERLSFIERCFRIRDYPLCVTYVNFARVDVMLALLLGAFIYKAVRCGEFCSVKCIRLSFITKSSLSQTFCSVCDGADHH